MKKYGEEEMGRRLEEDTKKQERLLDAMGKIDEDLVADAALDRGHKKKSSWLFWGIAAAACLALVIFVGAEFILKDTPEDGTNDNPTQKFAAGESQAETEILSGVSPEGGEGENRPEREEDRQIEILEPDAPEELTVLAISDNNVDGQGYEGYMVRDISELVNANPWNEELPLKALPVYKNPRTYDKHWFVSNPDWEGMKKRLEEVILLLGFSEEDFEIGDNAPKGEDEEKIREKLSDEDEEFINTYLQPTEITAQRQGLTIRVEKDLSAWISYDPAIVLPEPYSFTYHASYEELRAIGSYLKEQYDGKLIRMGKPQLNISGGDYTYQADRQRYDLEFFDMEGSITEQIVNYNFNRVEFCASEEGTMNLVRIYQPDLSETMGNYPIISTEEARALLLNGNYITTVPYEMPGEEYIAKVELVYGDGAYDQYYMPYYKFYVELPEEKRDHGLKDFGAYYVPAVEGSYLSNMPTWDGSFN
ncbi:MAG: hypothetical protein HFI67_02425 [Lachnospiraceae bacterium]|jgi:hypothetical protein|nr:hypothetical protein [Lachnospiraceae bacterium]